MSLARPELLSLTVFRVIFGLSELARNISSSVIPSFGISLPQSSPVLLSSTESYEDYDSACKASRLEEIFRDAFVSRFGHRNSKRSL